MPNGPLVPEYLNYLQLKFRANGSSFLCEWEDETIHDCDIVRAQFRGSRLVVSVEYNEPVTPDEHGVPSSATEALTELRKLEARTEIGINKLEYNRELGEVWFSVRTFLKSDDVKLCPPLANHIRKAMTSYTKANENWGGTFAQKRLRAYWALASCDIAWAVKEAGKKRE